MNDTEQAVTALLERALREPGAGSASPSTRPDVEVVSLTDANEGRGVFSRVIRAELAWPHQRETSGNGDHPQSVVVKLPALGSNGEVAAAAGAYRRESLAYRDILPASPVLFPLPYLVADDGDRSSFVLQDLQDHRMVDQLHGLDRAEALAVAQELARFHHHWQTQPGLESLDVRRSTPAGLKPEALEAGLALLNDRWAEALTDEQVQAFRRLVGNRQHLADAFADLGPVTLCHGDPRADNLAFDAAGRAVLYDWQQMAVQFGAADLAWLAATSLTPTLRRALDRELIEAYGTNEDTYRLGFVLPGLAVLLLCQRELTDERSHRFVATSLARIGTALVDLDVDGLRAESLRG